MTGAISLFYKNIKRNFYTTKSSKDFIKTEKSLGSTAGFEGKWTIHFSAPILEVVAKGHTKSATSRFVYWRNITRVAYY